MNGAQALIRTLVDSGVDTCFMNPGTSEMHFVAALDDVPQMRGVLTLFEGVATGAADGYARMAGKPAATLLHLGPGLGNGLANLHNARKAYTPVVNIVGDHATYHKQYDAQLESDIETVANNVSAFIRWSQKADEVGRDAAETVAAAFGPPGQVATQVLAADAAWSGGGVAHAPIAVPAGAVVDDATVDYVASVLHSGEPTAILIGGRACLADSLTTVAAIAAKTGAKLLCETFPARLARGAGCPPVERIAYLAEFAAMQLDGLKHLVLIDAKSPVSFFAYPDKASDLVPDGCHVHQLVGPADQLSAIDALARVVGASAADAPRQAAARPELPTGELNASAVCQTIGALLPANAIVSDEGNTSGLFAAGFTAGAPAHDWLTLTGGAIGQGLPVAVGAAIACPDRKVIALEADGSAMYTLQSLWTMAREQLDIVTVVFNNHSYAVLNMELDRVGATAGGAKAKAMLDLHHPEIDFVSLAQGMGVRATCATTAEEFNEQFAAAVAQSGPTLIDARVPSIL
ncbi:MAG: acetolactate synthase large subunit [Acidimicrobiia bacterium]